MTWKLILIALVAIMGNWKLIIPAATTNLCVNPSFETNTTGWSASGTNTIAQSSDAQMFGNYSLKATYQDNTTLASDSITLPTTNTTYTLTAWLNVPAN